MFSEDDEESLDSGARSPTTHWAAVTSLAARLNPLPGAIKPLILAVSTFVLDPGLLALQDVKPMSAIIMMLPVMRIAVILLSRSIALKRS